MSKGRSPGARADSSTIAALSTAPAKSGVAVIRISGAGAFAILDAVFVPSGAKNAAMPGAAAFGTGDAVSEFEWIDRQLVYGTLYSTERLPIDRCMAVRFSAPKSYTGENVCELHLHGSMAIVASALEHIYAVGARPAEPGEFTRRAFLAGKLGLADAEAVGALIDADTAEAAANAALQVGGALSRAVGGVYDTLLGVIARFRAVCDYPEEDIEPASADEIIRSISEAAAKLRLLLERSGRAAAYLSGVECAIIGRPNVGKSSIFNRLVGSARAIVTPLAGTTRDTLDARVMLGGVPLVLVDTAGLRGGAEGVEALGIERTVQAARRASLVLAVFDASTPLSDEDLQVLEAAQHPATCSTLFEKDGDLSEGVRQVLYVLNKCDLGEDASHTDTAALSGPRGRQAVSVSAVTGEGFDALAAAVSSLYDKGDLQFDGTLLATVRQNALVAAAERSLGDCASALRSGIEPDVALGDAERAAAALGELLGRTASTDIVDAVFRNFCVGK